jgi:hypothetical protein
MSVVLALLTEACFDLVSQIAERVRGAVKKEMKHVNEMLVHVTPGMKASGTRLLRIGQQFSFPVLPMFINNHARNASYSCMLCMHTRYKQQ